MAVTPHDRSSHSIRRRRTARGDILFSYSKRLFLTEADARSFRMVTQIKLRQLNEGAEECPDQTVAPAGTARCFQRSARFRSGPVRNVVKSAIKTIIAKMRGDKIPKS